MYVLRPPHPDLAGEVEHYWFVDHAPGEEVDLRVDVFVDGRADLILNAGVAYHRAVIGGATREVPGSVLDAQRLEPIRITQRGAVRVAGVRFRVGGLAPFARAPLAAWTGATPEPTAVLGPEAGALDAAVRAERDPDALAAVVDAWLLAHRRVDAATDAVARALAALEADPGRHRVAEVADAAGVGSRQLERLFARLVGIPPATVGRILRFQGTLRTLMADPAIPLGDVASAHGYFDQAHFVREFRRFSGGVPRGYRGYYPPEAPRDFAPNVVAFVQDEAAPTPRD